MKGREYLALTMRRIEKIIAYLDGTLDQMQKLYDHEAWSDDSINFSTDVWGGAGPDCHGARVVTALYFY